jgi:hypothetical protein
MRQPSYAWTLFDYFYSGEVDQARYASVHNAQAIMVALEQEYKGEKAKTLGNVSDSTGLIRPIQKK